MNNQTVVITGGSKGIGAACVQSFLDAGCNVAILDIVALARPVGDRLYYLSCDVSNGSQVKESMRAVHEKFGSIDFLVNNAAIQKYGTVSHTSEEEWDLVMNVNLKSVFLCSRYAIPYMEQKGGGVVINIASVQAFMSQPNVAAYTTAKSAILGLTRSIAIDYAPGIRCVAVCPGSIDTPLLRDAIALSPDPDAVMQECIDMHILKRIGKPEEVAGLVQFLCSDKAGFITGQAIRVDGGLGITIQGSKKETT